MFLYYLESILEQNSQSFHEASVLREDHLQAQIHVGPYQGGTCVIWDVGKFYSASGSPSESVSFS